MLRCHGDRSAILWVTYRGECIGEWHVDRLANTLSASRKTWIFGIITWREGGSGPGQGENSAVSRGREIPVAPCQSKHKERVSLCLAAGVLVLRIFTLSERGLTTIESDAVHANIYQEHFIVVALRGNSGTDGVHVCRQKSLSIILSSCLAVKKILSRVSISWAKYP